MTYTNCHPAARNRAKVTGLPGLLNLFLDELPLASHKNHFSNVNVSETANSYDIEVLLPGFDKSDFKVQLDGKYLHISAEKSVANTSETPAEDKDRRYIRREFAYSTSFKRTFTMPEQADTTAINAQYNNGILTLSIRKKTVTTPEGVQHIEVV